MPHPPHWRVGPRLAALARLAVAATVLAYLFAQVPVAALADSLRGVAWPPLAAAFLLALATYVAVAERCRRLLRAFGPQVSRVEMVQIHLATLFYSLFLPAGTLSGLAIRYYSLARRERSYAGIAVALVLDRIVATNTLCAVGLAFWLLDARPASWPAAAVLGGGLGALVLAQAALFMDRGLPSRARRRLRLRERLPARLVSLGEALRQARSLPRDVRVLAFTLGVLAHLLGTVAYGLTALAIGLDVPIMALGWVRAAAIFAAIVPVSVAGLGVREGATVLLLAPLGVAAADALAFALLVFAVTILGNGLLGGATEAKRLLLDRVTLRPGIEPGSLPPK